jgi:hypothetical protein
MLVNISLNLALFNQMQGDEGLVGAGLAERRRTFALCLWIQGQPLFATRQSAIKHVHREHVARVQRQSRQDVKEEEKRGRTRAEQQGQRSRRARIHTREEAEEIKEGSRECC